MVKSVLSQKSLYETMAIGFVEFTIKNCSQADALVLADEHKVLFFKYDANERTCVIRINPLDEVAHKEVDDVQDKHLVVPDVEVNQALLKSLREKYVECAKVFIEWKKSRETLINILKDRAQQLDNNFFYGSCVRAATGSLNLVSNVTDYVRPYLPSWSTALIENATVISLFSNLVERALSQKLHFDVKKAIEEDKKNFSSMIKRFEQHEEFSPMQSLFPYGMQEDLIVKVENCSSESDSAPKIFLSIVFSEIKDINIFKSKGFHNVIGKLLRETGVKLFKKILLNNNKTNKEAMPPNITEEVLNIVKKDNNDTKGHESSEKEDIEDTKDENGETECNDIDLSKLFMFRIICKACLDGIDIYSAVSDIWNNEKSYESGKLRMLALMATMELEAIKSYFKEIESLGIKFDPDLEREIYI